MRHSRRQTSMQRQLQNHSHRKKQNGAKPPPSSVPASVSQLPASTALTALGERRLVGGQAAERRARRLQLRPEMRPLHGSSG